MKGLPWFKCYAAAVMSDVDVDLMSNEIFGGYWRLLLREWIEGGFRYTDEQLVALARFNTCTTDVQHILNRFVTLKDGRRVHPIMEEQRISNEAVSKARSKAGKASAKAKREKQLQELKEAQHVLSTCSTREPTNGQQNGGD